jgi:hypothetical protein
MKKLNNLTGKNDLFSADAKAKTARSKRDLKEFYY